MKKDRILELARKRKTSGKEFENKEVVNSNGLGFAIAILLGAVLLLVELLLKNSVNWSLLSIYLASAGIQSLYEGIKTKKFFAIILGCIELILTIFTIIKFFAQVVS